MTLIQPDHSDRKRIQALGLPCATDDAGVRVGLLNIMPRAHEYERYLLASLAALPLPVRPVYLRLASHRYGSTPQPELARYRTWDAAGEEVDALLLTGAPVEHLPVEQVRYWPELTAVLDDADRRKLPVFGICWGGMVLARRMGMAWDVVATKIFGLFPANTVGDNDLGGDATGRFVCPHSRFAGLDPDSVREAERTGRARLLAEGPGCGPFLVESHDGLRLGHLGHPEYPAGRLEAEWERDRRAGRTDVRPPVGLAGHEGRLLWADHRDRVFQRWLSRVRKPVVAETTGGVS